MMRILAVAILAASAGLPQATRAQSPEVPVIEHAGDGQAASCGLSEVVGLRADGDGFLAIRTGPGTRYRQIGALHNGDRVTTFSVQGDWVGIAHGDGRLDQPDVCANDGPERQLSGPGLGWVHGRWLRHIAP